MEFIGTVLANQSKHNYLTKKFKKKLAEMLEEPEEEQRECPSELPQQNKKSRCALCPRQKDRKTKLYCESCRRTMCDDHRYGSVLSALIKKTCLLTVLRYFNIVL